MSRKGWIYIAIGILTLAAMFALEYNKPKKINWFPSYVSHHKIPYGTYVLNDVMEKHFPDAIQHLLAECCISGTQALWIDDQLVRCRTIQFQLIHRRGTNILTEPAPIFAPVRQITLGCSIIKQGG